MLSIWTTTGGLPTLYGHREADVRMTIRTHSAKILAVANLKTFTYSWCFKANLIPNFMIKININYVIINTEQFKLLIKIKCSDCSIWIASIIIWSENFSKNYFWKSLILMLLRSLSMNIKCCFMTPGIKKVKHKFVEQRLTLQFWSAQQGIQWTHHVFFKAPRLLEY